MNSYAQVSQEIQKLRFEKVELEQEEAVLKVLIDKLKNQINAVQIEQLEIKNREPALSDEYLKELAGSITSPASHSQDILDQMVRGNFSIQEEPIKPL